MDASTQIDVFTTCKLENAMIHDIRVAVEQIMTIHEQQHAYLNHTNGAGEALPIKLNPKRVGARWFRGAMKCASLF